MQHKKEETFDALLAAIDEYRLEHDGEMPTVYILANMVGIGQGTVSKYLKAMREDGRIVGSGHRNMITRAAREETRNQVRVPVLGRVACGLPTLEEESVEEIYTLPASLVGEGDMFILYASGNSMIGAGIEDGDRVLVRCAETARYNDIVVALVDNENTLKRYRPLADGLVCLHPENPAFEDILTDDCRIQGVAVMVMKNL